MIVISQVGCDGTGDVRASAEATRRALASAAAATVRARRYSTASIPEP